METILGRADGGEHLVVGPAGQAQGGRQQRRAQERIGRSLLRHGGGHGRLAARAGREYGLALAFSAGEESTDRAKRALAAVYSWALYRRVSSGKAAMRDRLAHICWRVALEHPPASQGKDAVADEGDVVRRVMVGDVLQGVAAHVDHYKLGLAPD